MYDEIGALQERLDALNPKERVELLIKLMPYALPKVTWQKISRYGKN